MIFAFTQGVQCQIDTGKSYLLAGKDRRGRAVIVVHVKHHDPKQQTVDELTRFGVHVLLRAEEALPPSPQPVSIQESTTNPKVWLLFAFFYTKNQSFSLV